MSLGTNGDDRLKSELRWVALNAFLRMHGYELRPRYQPDWVPSWKNDRHPLKIKADCEDAVWYLKPSIVDAVRVKDGTPVVLKLVNPEEDPTEQYARFFSEPPRRDDPRNRVCPVLQVLQPDIYPDRVIIVMPRFIPWNLWPFRKVCEAMNFFGEVFEGLAFMHENHFAHLDLGLFNIMMDGLHLYTEPCHPAKPIRALYEPRDARHVERYESKEPIKYYFIDLEGSIRFDSHEDRHPVVRTRYADDTVPEEQARSDVPVDPFAVDVYCLGNLLREHWLEAYKNVDFMQNLVDEMVQRDPTLRPTAQEVVERFQAIRKALTPKQLSKALRRNSEYFYHHQLFKRVLDEEKKREKQEARELKLAARAARPATRNFLEAMLALLHRRSGEPRPTADVGVVSPATTGSETATNGIVDI